MKTEEVIKKLEQAQQRALRQVGEIAIGIMEPYVPVWLGNLRRSARVEIEGDQVVIKYGGKTIFSTRDIKYAKRQYHDKLRHFGGRGDYKDLSTLDPGKPKGRTERKTNKPVKLGSTQDVKYRRAYNWAVDISRLQKSTAKWAEIITKDKAKLKMLGNVYTNVLKNILK